MTKLIKLLSQKDIKLETAEQKRKFVTLRMREAELSYSLLTLKLDFFHDMIRSFLLSADLGLFLLPNCFFGLLNLACAVMMFLEAVWDKKIKKFLANLNAERLSIH